MARCKSCGAEILWANTVDGDGNTTGKTMPVDKEPTVNGNVRLMRRGGGEIMLVAYVEAGPVEGGRLSHFATCPNASQHRKAAS